MGQPRVFRRSRRASIVMDLDAYEALRDRAEGSGASFSSLASGLLEDAAGAPERSVFVLPLGPGDSETLRKVAARHGKTPKALLTSLVNDLLDRT